MIWTSYFAKLSQFNIDEFHLLSIANSAPEFAKHLGRWNAVVPSWDLVRASKAGEISHEEYTIRYREYLSKVQHFNQMIEGLLTQRKDVVLFCWESPEKFCHRRILADYINKMFKCKLITEFEF